LKSCRIATLSLLTLAGCALSPPPQQSLEQEPEFERVVRELEHHKATLANHRGANDCPEVCRLGELICTASGRICLIASRHEREERFARRCQNSQKDCAAARGLCAECTSAQVP